MRLKSIKLAGFKSFVDPTTVQFPGNMCAVVGLFCVVYGVIVSEDAFARFFGAKIGFILRMILLFLLPVMPFWFFWPVMLTWMSM